MNSQEIMDTAKALVADDKGILAMDESNPTCNKRFARLGIPQTGEAHRSYREMIVTTPGLGECISGAILYDETIRQTTSEGVPFVQAVIDAGIIPGVKVDAGAKDMAGHPGEKVTEGLDRLRDRLVEYVRLGARFAKWRAVRKDVHMNARARSHADPILSARNIVNRFGKQVVHDKLSLDIEAGEIIGIAGGSGAGKSVLLKTLTGLHTPDAGEVLINGKAVQSIGAAEKAAMFGVLFQQGALFSSLSVAQNIMLPMREHTSLAVAEQEQIAAMKLALSGCRRHRHQVSRRRFPAAW